MTLIDFIRDWAWWLVLCWVLVGFGVACIVGFFISAMNNFPDERE